MYKLIACALILSTLIQESVQDGDCPDCPVCGAPTADAEITSSFSKTRRRRQASINPEPGKIMNLELCIDGLVLNVILCIIANKLAYQLTKIFTVMVLSDN